MKTPKNSQQRIIEVKTSIGYKIIDSNKVLFLEAKGKFTVIHLIDQSQIITYHMLKWYNNNLFEPYFFRCHNSYSINCSYVNCYNSKEIVLVEGSKVPLSRSKLCYLKENLRYLIEIQDNA